MGARQHVHQRRLAGAVAADQGDDLAGVQVDGDAVDGVDAAERHADVAQLDERRRHARSADVSARTRIATVTAFGSTAASSPLAHRAVSSLDRRRSHESTPTATTSTMPT